MPAMPSTGGSAGTWGAETNTFLNLEHDTATGIHRFDGTTINTDSASGEFATGTTYLCTAAGFMYVLGEGAGTAEIRIDTDSNASNGTLVAYNYGATNTSAMAFIPKGKYVYIACDCVTSTNFWWTPLVKDATAPTP